MSLRFREIRTPIGAMLAVWSRGTLVRLAFPEEDPEGVLEATADALGGPVRPGGPHALAGEIDDYFAGRRTGFDVPHSLALVPAGFTTRVLEATRRIPYGSVATYGEIAARAGSPRGGRAAGNALNVNPLALVIPCHRVVPASGGIGGYGGREDRKAALLSLEGAVRPTPEARSA